MQRTIDKALAKNEESHRENKTRLPPAALSARASTTTGVLCSVAQLRIAPD
jgi:hypothetical protein